MDNMPKHYKLVKGIGTSIYPLVAFDNALKNAGISDYNLVKVSSIIPANCQKTDAIDLPNGSILYAAYSSVTIKDKKSQYVGVAVAIPKDKNESGVIFECRSDSTPDKDLFNMCRDAMSSRNKSDYQYEDCIQKVTGISEMYSSAIAAVVLW